MKKHTGKIRHSDMTSLVRGHGKKDKHASDEHHKANSKHGMPHGLSHDEDEYGEGSGEGGSMGGNCEYC